MNSRIPQTAVMHCLLFTSTLAATSFLATNLTIADEPASSNETPSQQSVLHNRLEIHPKLMSGAAPDGDEAYAELKRRGIRVIVSVDGQRPDVEAARKYGLRYIHIPIGYDAVGEEACRSALALTRSIDEPIYVHCHHGKHRGPAMAAVIAQSAGWLNRKEAVDLLRKAGTGTQYSGLWRDVDGFRPLPVGTELPELVEIAEVSTLASHMVDTSVRYEVLVDAMKSGDWNVSDVRLLQEALRESHRVCNEEMRPAMMKSAELVHSMEAQVMRGDTEELRQSMARLKEACNQCHTRHRN